MKKYNFKEDISHNSIFELVAKASKSLGIDSYVVGGFVRDLILERPNKDIDFVCVGSGIELAKTTASLIKEDLHVNYFKNFGTAQFNFGEFDIEFVGARKESYRSDSRKPLVEDGSLSEDQHRRDFTINAMGISLNPDNFGELVDPFDGVGDIERKIIKTPLNPKTTFSDDPLRMMRAIRFASQLGFDIET
jgi:tRNA nucleotidyltransferase/poly(A) polymerase